MMGKDIERILKKLDKCKRTADGLLNLIYSVQGALMSARYQYEDHYEIRELPYPVNPDKFNELRNAVKELKEDADKVKQIGEKMFTDIYKVNNSVGSPWTEIQSAVDTTQGCIDFITTNPTLEYTTNRMVMMNKLTLTIVACVDAKITLCRYYDWLQRGFDHEFNNNEPSITYQDDIEGNESTGNMDDEQDIDDNVHVHDKSIDPY